MRFENASLLVAALLISPTSSSAINNDESSTLLDATVNTSISSTILSTTPIESTDTPSSTLQSLDDPPPLVVPDDRSPAALKVDEAGFIASRPDPALVQDDPHQDSTLTDKLNPDTTRDILNAYKVNDATPLSQKSISNEPILTLRHSVSKKPGLASQNLVPSKPAVGLHQSIQPELNQTWHQVNVTESTSDQQLSIPTPPLLPNSTADFSSLSSSQNITFTQPYTTSTHTLNLPPSGYMVNTMACEEDTKVEAQQANQPGIRGECRDGSRLIVQRNCTPLPPSKTLTVYIITHTSTTTFTGKRDSYTSPYPPIVTPDFCTPSIYPVVPDPPLPNLYASVPWKDNEPQNGATMPGPIQVTDVLSFRDENLDITYLPTPILAPPRRPVSTVYITDKNPAVEFVSDPIPVYSQTWSAGGVAGYKIPVDQQDDSGGVGGDGVGGRVGGDTGGGTGVGRVGVDTGGSGQVPAQYVQFAPVHVVVAGQSEVVINGQPFAVPKTITSSITVTPSQGGVFTIGQSSIVVQDQTITRKPLDPGPSSSVIGGIVVVSDGPYLKIGGGTFTMPVSTSYTARVNGKVVSINLNNLTIGGESMGFLRPPNLDVIVAGGEMATVIGQSIIVVRTVTYTYGQGIPRVVTVINDDPITIDSTGVIVHGSTLGGVSASPTDTEYVIVGGATIATRPPSMVVVNNVTHTVGPEAAVSTVVVGDQTLTMAGPDGLIMSGTTMGYPFDVSVTATIIGRLMTAPPVAKKTGAGAGAGAEDEEDSGSSLRPNLVVGLACLCIVFGVLIIG